MARVLVFVFLVVVGWACGAVGQEEQRRGWSTLQFGWVFWNMSELNQLLEAQGYPTLPESCFIWGGQNTIVLRGWNLNIANWHGDAVAKSDEKLTKLTLTWFGGSGERALPRLPLGSFVNLTLGVGIASLTVLDHRPASFAEALSSPAGAFFTRWFFTVSPQLGVRFPLLTFKLDEPITLMLTLSAGYTLTFDNGAWDQEGRALKGPPANFNGWIVQLMVGLE